MTTEQQKNKTYREKEEGETVEPIKILLPDGRTIIARNIVAVVQEQENLEEQSLGVIATGEFELMELMEMQKVINLAFTEIGTDLLQQHPIGQMFGGILEELQGDIQDAVNEEDGQTGKMEDLISKMVEKIKSRK